MGLWFIWGFRGLFCGLRVSLGFRVLLWGGFCRLALVFLCILPMYLEAPYAFCYIQYYLSKKNYTTIECSHTPYAFLTYVLDYL